MSRFLEKVHFTWSQFDASVEFLAERIRRSGLEVHNVYGIPRGGLIPAVALSHVLGLPLVDSINGHTLVVDDISDSGQTLQECAGGCMCTVTLHYVLTSAYQPTFWACVREPNKWVVYPWERR